MSNSLYPEMTVEKRVSTTAHGLKPPTKEGTPYYIEQVQDTVTLCQETKKGDWTDKTYDILKKYSPIKFPSRAELIVIMSDYGFNSWNDVCEFVKYDECIDFMVKTAKYAKKHNLKVKKNKGFIDGQGIGVYRRYIDRLKLSLERTFDAKYYFNQERPLEVLYIDTGIDFSGLGVVHPGHPTYPAGHGAKFYESVDMASCEWELGEHRGKLIIAAYVTAMGRSGIMVHKPEDNVASGYLAGLKEFKKFGK